MEPMRFPSKAQKPSIGPVTQALKKKGSVDWSKPHAPGGVADALKHIHAEKGFDHNKVGKAKEAPERKSPKEETKKHRSKEAPF